MKEVPPSILNDSLSIVSSAVLLADAPLGPQQMTSHLLLELLR